MSATKQAVSGKWRNPRKVARSSHTECRELPFSRRPRLPDRNTHMHSFEGLPIWAASKVTTLPLSGDGAVAQRNSSPGTRPWWPLVPFRAREAAKLPDLPRPIEMRVSVNGTIVRLGREWRKRAPSRARGDDDARGGHSQYPWQVADRRGSRLR